jgi:ElaB/YqjD/DUF883 family membrane-anchored ribosome-binding protein
MIDMNRDDMQSSANAMAEQAGNLAQVARDGVQHAGRRAREATRGAVDWATSRAADAADAAVDLSGQAYDTTREAIRAQPVWAVAGALLAGLALGALLFSSRDRY